MALIMPNSALRNSLTAEKFFRLQSLVTSRALSYSDLAGVCIMPLSAKFLEIARRELGEDEERKREYLRHFNDWLDAHRFIKSCRRDDNFLLQFLRVRKFNIESTFATFENFFLLRKKYEKWCKIDEVATERLWELFDSGYAYPLLDRDDEGKRIIFIQAKRFDTKKFNSIDAVRLLGVIVIALMEEEETQIAGISTISDFTDTSFSYFNLFSIRDVKDFADFVRNVSVGREKENYFVNLPTVAAFLFEIGRKAMNEKMRSRMISTKNMMQVIEHVDVNLLPKEIGGKSSEKEMMEAFKKLYKAHETNLTAISEYEIDWENVEAKRSCAVM